MIDRLKASITWITFAPVCSHFILNQIWLKFSPLLHAELNKVIFWNPAALINSQWEHLRSVLSPKPPCEGGLRTSLETLRFSWRSERETLTTWIWPAPYFLLWDEDIVWHLGGAGRNAVWWKGQIQGGNCMLDMLGLTLAKLTGVTMEGCPNLMGRRMKWQKSTLQKQSGLLGEDFRLTEGFWWRAVNGLWIICRQI